MTITAARGAALRMAEESAGPMTVTVNTGIVDPSVTETRVETNPIHPRVLLRSIPS